MTDEDLIKTRDIVFHALPPDQVSKALPILNRLEGIEAHPAQVRCGVSVRYDVRDYTLEHIEAMLTEMRFHLEPGVLQKIRRALINYTETVQRENLAVPPKYYKSSLQVFIKAYQETLHGDEDLTPEEWRNYR